MQIYFNFRSLQIIFNFYVVDYQVYIKSSNLTENCISLIFKHVKFVPKIVCGQVGLVSLHKRNNRMKREIDNYLKQ